MKTKYALSLLGFGTFAFVIWTLQFLASCFHKENPHNFLDSQITGIEWAIAIHFAALLLALVILNETIHVLRKGSHGSLFTATRFAWLFSLVATNANSTPVPTPITTSNFAPMASSLSPVAAISLLVHIERKRRDQLNSRQYPDVFTEEEMELLRKVRMSASRIAEQDKNVINDVSPFDDVRLLNAVNRVKDQELSELMTSNGVPWVIEVKVFGYPTVVSIYGDVGEFRKKRALELLTWLALNRDRARRSAARTALWEIDVSDSSFSTVVSDMRRALRELDVKNEVAQWVPTTYSDELSLSPLVVTDADRLRVAHDSYVRSKGLEVEELQNVLQGIRDVPFAGTNYAWADLDGTTTRLIISAIEVCTDVAQIAGQQQKNDLVDLAVTAGLRVFPGCEELLEIQNHHLARSFPRRVRKDTHRFVSQR